MNESFEVSVVEQYEECVDLARDMGAHIYLMEVPDREFIPGYRAFELVRGQDSMRFSKIAHLYMALKCLARFGARRNDDE